MDRRSKRCGEDSFALRIYRKYAVRLGPFRMAPRLLSHSQLRPVPAQGAGTHPTTLAGGVLGLPTALYSLSSKGAPKTSVSCVALMSLWRDDHVQCTSAIP